MYLLFFDKNADTVGQMQEAFSGHSQLNAKQLAPDQIATYDALDALYLPLIAAERWRPRPLFYQSQILETSKDDEQWPKFIVAGIALKSDDTRAGDALAELQLTIEAVVCATKLYNNENGSPIKTVGFWTDSLRIHKMNPYQAGSIIRLAYDKASSSDEMSVI